MTNKQNKWTRERRQKLIQEFGGKCEECPATENLEFAHKEDTGLSGEGRGRKERQYDVINHPKSYRLLCKDCHEDYDNQRDYEEAFREEKE